MFDYRFMANFPDGLLVESADQFQQPASSSSSTHAQPPVRKQQGVEISKPYYQLETMIVLLKLEFDGTVNRCNNVHIQHSLREKAGDVHELLIEEFGEDVVKWDGQRDRTIHVDVGAMQ